VVLKWLIKKDNDENTYSLSEGNNPTNYFAKTILGIIAEISLKYFH